jgi:curved DNA-binding protein CbpA
VSGTPDPYKTLGVDPGAEPKVIAAAHRVLARRHHPDVSRDPGAEARMAEINAAWTILRDPVRRAAYDLGHGIRNGHREGAAANPLSVLQTRPPKSSSPTSPSMPRSPGGAGSPLDATGHGSGTGLGSPSAPAPPPASLPVGRRGEVVWRRGPDGEGAAGPPPGRPVGSVLPFGRHIGWSLGEVARVDPGYLQWLAGKADGRPYQAEIEKILGPILRTADGRGQLNAAEGPDAWRDPRRRR